MRYIRSPTLFSRPSDWNSHLSTVDACIIPETRCILCPFLLLDNAQDPHCLFSSIDVLARSWGLSILETVGSTVYSSNTIRIFVLLSSNIRDNYHATYSLRKLYTWRIIEFPGRFEIWWWFRTLHTSVILRNSAVAYNTNHVGNYHLTSILTTSMPRLRITLSSRSQLSSLSYFWLQITHSMPWDSNGLERSIDMN